MTRLSLILALLLTVTACGDDVARVSAPEIAEIEALAFAQTQLDRTSQQQFRIRNNGDGDLQIRNLEIQNASPFITFTDGFVVQMETQRNWRAADGRQTWSDHETFVVEARREIQVDIQFTPTSTDPACPGGTPTETCGTIVIESNDRNEPILEINITLNQSAGTIEVEPTVIDFPAVTGGPYQETFEIQNVGAGPLTGVSVTDPGLPGLTLVEVDSRGEPFTLQVGDVSTYQVNFSPVAGFEYCQSGTPEEGCTIGSVRIQSDDATGAQIFVTLTVGGADLPEVDVDPLTLQFDAAAPGSPESQQVEVSNLGGSNLTWNLRIDPPAMRDLFALEARGTAVPPSGQSLSPIAPDNVEVVDITLEPVDETAVVAELIIRTNDPDEGTVTVELFGGDPTPDLAVEPTQLFFQDVPTGTSADLQFVVWNSGRATLNIATAELAGSEEFSFDPDLTGMTLAPGARRAVTVTYSRPGNDLGGLDNATINIMSDALAPNDDFTFNLFAYHEVTALPPTAELEATPDPPYAVEQTITLDASGSRGPDDTDLQANPFTWTLLARPPGSSAELSNNFEATTTLTPDSTGTYTVLLTVTAVINATVRTQAQRTIDLLVQ